MSAGRLVAAFVILLVASATPGGVARGAPGAAGADQITVLSQTPWVEASGDFHLRLAVSAADAADEQLVVQGYGRLTTRTAFDDALTGRFDSGLAYTTNPMPLTSLKRDPSGGVDIDIPVNETGASGALPEFTASSVGGSGVFPIQVSLANRNGVTQGQPLTTFLVFAAGTAKQTGLPSLSVSVTLPVYAPPQFAKTGSLTALAPAGSADVSGVVDDLLAHPDVPVSLAVTPQTLDALAYGSSTDKLTLADLAGLVKSGGDEVLPEPYAYVPLSGLVAGGLQGELAQQISAGRNDLAAVLGAPPSTTWVVDQPLDPATLQRLQAGGARRLIVPASELSGLPPIYQQLTFASPATMTSGNGPMPVYGADPGLTADFDNAGGPVLAASQLLAELAMIQLETPGNVRGVAVLPPSGQPVDPAFVETLLSGLDGHPLLRAVTATKLFSVPAATPTVDRTLVPPTSPPGPSSSTPSSGASSTTATTLPATQAVNRAAAQLFRQSGTILDDRNILDAVHSIFPTRGTQASRVIELAQQLLDAESVDISAAQRTSLVSLVHGQGARLLGGISLPAASITLTSTKGQIPLTILMNTGGRANVVLTLQSQRLIFRPFSSHCQIHQKTNEQCTFTLTAQNTTLKVPVEARSSGVFPLEVALWSPSGRRLLDYNVTVRSTAVSGVGIVLIAVAILGLAIWWVRDLRHGRRPGKLVPAPVDDPVGPPPAVRPGAAVGPHGRHAGSRPPPV